MSWKCNICAHETQGLVNILNHQNTCHLKSISRGITKEDVDNIENYLESLTK